MLGEQRHCASDAVLKVIRMCLRVRNSKNTQKDRASVRGSLLGTANSDSAKNPLTHTPTLTPIIITVSPAYFARLMGVGPPAVCRRRGAGRVREWAATPASATVARRATNNRRGVIAVELLLLYSGQFATTSLLAFPSWRSPACSGRRPRRSPRHPLRCIRSVHSVTFS